MCLAVCLVVSFSNRLTATPFPPPPTSVFHLHASSCFKNCSVLYACSRYLGEEHLEAPYSILLCTSKRFVETFNSMSWSIHASVQKETSMIHQKLVTFAKLKNPKTEFKNPSTFASFLLDKSFIRTCHLKDKTPCGKRYKTRSLIHCPPVYCMGNGDPDELSDEDEELCPVECVREIKKDGELFAVLEKAKEANSLVVVDFYRTSCGSCKYIEQGFAKLCKGLGDEEAAVIFLKHNVIDEYDEQSEIAERLRIKSVPLFHFYKNGILLEAFATRDKVRIKEAIDKYTAPASTAAQNA